MNQQNSDIEEAKDKAKALENDLEKVSKEKRFSRSAIDNLNSERDTLSRFIDTVSNRTKDLNETKRVATFTRVLRVYNVSQTNTTRCPCHGKVTDTNLL
ncbi:hypothetical protein JCM33374_g952 [Metschnikowia sp. JCM 33374]|nr:hypothetical protein JCM33374_g952 [Metschnikowia sp. JCM 33374]